MSSAANDSTSTPKMSSNELAIIRTALANERTCLAFVRSGFAAIGLGIKLETVYPILFGLGFVIAGMFRYYQVRHALSRVESEQPVGNPIMEVIVFGCLALVYWVVRRRF